MINLFPVLEAILPILLTILVGYFLRSTRFISDEGFAAFDKLCFRLLLPALLFSNIYSADFSRDFNTYVILFLLGSTLLVFLIVFSFVPRLFPLNNADKVTMVHAISHGNLAVIGMPLISNLFGREALPLFSILLMTTTIIINPLMIFAHLHFGKEKLTLFRLVKGIVSSPFLLGTLFGLLFNLLGIRVPVAIQTTVSNLKGIATPLCLIALGGALKFRKQKSSWTPVIFSALAKCVMVPLIIIPLAIWVGFRGLALASISVIFLCPTATSTFSYCTGYCGNPEMAAQTILVSTVLSFFTMFACLSVLMSLRLI